MAHPVFSNLCQQGVASQTLQEGLCQSPQIETPDHFRKLLPQLYCPDVISVRYGAALEEAYVASPQNPPFAA
jgi:hypothetical protein